ncbi:MAG: hypothetical protein V3T58_02550 [Candidatus Hydrothermarchaeales archaeon]
MKAWKKGAIIGGVWSILRIPIFFVSVYLYGWERSLTPAFKIYLFFLAPFYHGLDFFGPKVFYTPFMKTLGTIFDFGIWILIGAGIGYFIDRRKNKPQN